MSSIFASAPDAAVGTTDTVLVTYAGAVFSAINVEMKNTGATAINTFRVQLQDHHEGEWYNYVGGADFDASSPGEGVLWVMHTRPDSLAPGATTHLRVDIGAAYGFRLIATVASGSTTITLRGYGK